MTGFGFVAAVSGDNIPGGLPGSSGQGTGLMELSITYTLPSMGQEACFYRGCGIHSMEGRRGPHPSEASHLIQLR